MIGEIRGGLVEMFSALTGESVVLLVIDMQGAEWIVSEASVDRGLGLRGYETVKRGDMREIGRAKGLGFIKQCLEANPVKADITIRVGSRGHEISQFAAEAITDTPDLTGTTWHGS